VILAYAGGLLAGIVRQLAGSFANWRLAWLRSAEALARIG
jgi:hypothetical protein